ncbi:MAG: hypothetical protein J7K95_03845 [Thermoplasmata archaeon]|nr:hypothetical protein [Thermoplasmata archaeon]
MIEMTIIISKNGKYAKKIEKMQIKREDYLQKYIYENPDSIPLYEIKEGIRICVLAREVPTNSGFIDALGLDSDGDIYIIETKLYKNPEKIGGGTSFRLWSSIMEKQYKYGVFH